MSYELSHNPALPDHLQLVIKLSKYCNLRCSYCYEFKELGQKDRMSLEQIEAMFRHIADYARDHGLKQLNFIWHGGEPFLLPFDYYDAIDALQKEVFGGLIRYSNNVQTNMTIMTDRHLERLAAGNFFEGLGMSFDVYGDQRVDVRGKLRTESVLRNMQKLMNADIPFSAIAVLARNTINDAEKIYEFYDKLGIAMRFLPFYMSAFEDQVDEHALTFDEIVTTIQSLFNAWAQSENATPVEPVREYIEDALHHINGTQTAGKFNKLREEMVYIVNLDGNMWGLAESYDQDYCYGNIFEQSLESILRSDARLRACQEAEARIAKHCTGCRYGDDCTSTFVSDATDAQQKLLNDHGCPVVPILDHIVKRIEENQLTDALGLAMENKALESVATSVAV